MSLTELVEYVTDKDQFRTVANYIAFCNRYLEYTETQLQARIVSQNENHYSSANYDPDIANS